MRIGKMRRSKLKEELKVTKTRGSVQLRSTKEHKPWKSKLKTQKTKNLRSVQRRNHVEEKNKFDLVYVTEKLRRRDRRRRDSATKRPWRRRFRPWRRCFGLPRSSLRPVKICQQSWKYQRPRTVTRGACRALHHFYNVFRDFVYFIKQ